MPIYVVSCPLHPAAHCGLVVGDEPAEAAHIFSGAHRLHTPCQSEDATVQTIDGEQLVFSVHLPTGNTRILSANGEPLLGEEGTSDRESGAVPRGIPQRQARLRAAIERHLPEFAQAALNPAADAILLTQDAFAANYQDAEYHLLGMAVKYAGLHGKIVEITPGPDLKQP